MNCIKCNLPIDRPDNPIRYNKKWCVKGKCNKCYTAEVRARRTTEALKRDYKLKQENYKKLRQKVLDILGRQCACCGETSVEFLSIDHINGGGREDRKKRNNHSIYRAIVNGKDDIKKYRTLCFNCNQAIGIYGYCPHNLER